MLKACELLQRGMHIEGEAVYLPPGPDMAQCWGFMEAVAQYAMLTDAAGKAWLNACPRDGMRVHDVLRIFVAYANAHPDELDRSAAAIARDAMASAFPCDAAK